MGVWKDPNLAKVDGQKIIGGGENVPGAPKKWRAKKGCEENISRQELGRGRKMVQRGCRIVASRGGGGAQGQRYATGYDWLGWPWFVQNFCFLDPIHRRLANKIIKQLDNDLRHHSHWIKISLFFVLQGDEYYQAIWCWVLRLRKWYDRFFFHTWDS